MRRLLPFVCAVIVVDTMLYAALTPLLPHFGRTYDLSKGGVGLVAAAYGIGTLVGALPRDRLRAARCRTAVLGGLVGVSLASVGVAFSDSFATLFAARFIQGCCSSLTWAGSLAWLALATRRERRGRTMGTAMASGVFGALLGPVVGAGGALIGVRAAFGAVAGVCALLAVGMARFEPSPPEPQPARAIFGAVRNAEFLRGLWLISLPALLFGTLNVLVPLALDKRGFTAAAIGAVWVATTAVGADLPGDRARLRVRSARAGHREGQGGAPRSVPPAAPLARFGSEVTRTMRRRSSVASWRSRCGRRLRARGAAAFVPARDGRGRARSREEPPLRRAVRLRRGPLRARSLAAGPVPSLRGGDRVLGAGRDRQGGMRRSSNRTRPRRRRRSSSAALPRRTRPRWLRSRLQPLVGAAGEPASQEESFTAWRRFLETWRRSGRRCSSSRTCTGRIRPCSRSSSTWPTGREGVPLLLLCTARPELYERHPTFGANARNAQRINLAPLSEEETARLVAALLERTVLPAETQQALLERAGGNPLYAEEFVRLLADRGATRASGREVPESVQALIAARLDTLPPERKSLLQDAAVLGKVFWAGAVAAMGGRDLREVEQALHELARKELVRSARASSMDGEAEYGFWHVLVRDVCYSQIPRADRAARHRAAAAWIEQKAGERAEDLAEVLAHHYLTALELARGRRAGRARRRSSRPRRSARSPSLPTEQSRWTSRVPKRAWPGRSSSPRRAPATRAPARALGERRPAAGAPARSEGSVRGGGQLYRERGDHVAAGRALRAHARDVEPR